MQIIVSHVNTDFDALASLIAAKKLHPEGQIVISDKQASLVKQFLNIYRDTFNFVKEKDVNWNEVTDIILVDVASLNRVSNTAKSLHHESLNITIYDHHPKKDGDLKKDSGIINQVGATVTILIEEIKKRALQISPLEATLFGLGIYTDTGFFTYKNTTARDLQAASYLMEHGMNLEIIQRFTEQTLDPEQQQLLDNLFIESETYEINGLQIVISSYQHNAFLSGLSTLTEKLLEVKGADAVITVVGMNKHVFVVGRASSDRISLLPLLKIWKGGGHEQAGSAMIKNSDRINIFNEVKGNLPIILKPAITAETIMTSPVKTISPNTTIEQAGNLMYRYKHSGYPVVDDGKLVGIITRRDLDKANHHGLGHAPVKAYMSTKIITISQNATLEEIQKIIIEHNIGRLPVVNNDKLIGIISRTNIIEAIHSNTMTNFDKNNNKTTAITNIANKLKKQLEGNIYSVLTDISKIATENDIPVYLIGGIVRDIFLNKENDDIDIVVEGDGISFAKELQQKYGGKLIIHDDFGTATWSHPTKLEIDIATSRLEYYDKPASLPNVETSTLKEDLSRRDFTVNAMAVCLNGSMFGNIIDPFSGQLDLQRGNITVLHNLSFIEDPTRILRAVRFELRFDFKMDEQTEQLAHNSIEKVADLSADRIINELKRLFKEHEQEEVIYRLFELKFWQQFGVNDKKMLVSCEHAKQLKKLYNNFYGATTSCNDKNAFNYFLIPFYNENNLTAAKRFALTKREIKQLNDIVAIQQEQIDHIKQLGDLHKVFKYYSDETILFYIASKHFDKKQLTLNYLKARQKIATFITGDDLLKLGLKPSSLFKTIFLQLEIQILNGEVVSTEDALNWVNQFIAENEVIRS